MTYHLLERDRDGGRQLAQALIQGLEGIGNCSRCRTLSENAICDHCASPKRDDSLLCVVENPTDLLALEQSGSYRGRYFVLMGHLSPLDGIGPTDLGLDLLDRRLAEEPVSELILATNPTIEGEATAHYISEMARTHGIVCSRIAHGVPLGGELEYVDSSTLGHAISGRQRY